MNSVVWQSSLRVLIVGSALVATLCVSHAATSPLTVSGLVLFTAIGAGASVFPDSHAGLPFLVAFGWYWWVNVEDSVTGWALLAALSLATYHTATAAAALAPWRAPGNRAVAIRWLSRLGVAWLATSAVWTLTAALDSDRQARAVPFGAALALVAALTWAMAMANARRAGDDSPKASPNVRP